MTHITKEQALALSVEIDSIGLRCALPSEIQALCTAAIEWHNITQAACDMGAMCLDCQPRGQHGECPDQAAPKAVPLTDEQIDNAITANLESNGGYHSFARAIEAAHGIGGKL